MMRKPSWLLALGLLVLCCADHAGAQNGIIPFADTARQRARGGTSLAIADSALNFNPATFAFIGGKAQFDSNLGVFWGNGRWKDRLGHSRRYKQQIGESVLIEPTFGAVFAPGNWGGSAAEVKDGADGGDAAAAGDGEEPAGDATPTPEPKPARDSIWRIGFGAFPLAGGGTEVDVNDELYTRDPVINRTKVTFLALAPSLSVRLTDWFAVGGTLLVSWAKIELDGLIQQPSSVLRGRLALPAAFNSRRPLLESGVFGPLVAGAARQVPHHGESFQHAYQSNTGFNTLQGTIDTSDMRSSGIGFRLGAMIRPHKTLDIGIAYQSPTWYRTFKTKAIVDFTRVFEARQRADLNELESLFNPPIAPPSGLFLIPGLVPGLVPGYTALPNGGRNGLRSRYTLELYDFRLPPIYGAGFAWKPCDWFRFSFDAKFTQWGKTFSRLKIRLKGGTNTDLNYLLGSNNLTTSLKLNWRDTWAFAHGVEFFLGEERNWTLSFGYNYGQSPVRKTYVTPQLPAVTEHHVTTGLAYDGEKYGFALGYSLGLPKTLRSPRTGNGLNESFSGGKLKWGATHFIVAGITVKFK